MANVKILIWKHKKINEKYPICLRITHNRKPVYYFTKYFCFEKDWNIEKERLYKSYRDFHEINIYLDNLVSKVNRIILDYEISNKPYTSSTIKNILIGKISKIDLLQFIDNIVFDCKKLNKFGNARVYNNLKSFLQKYTGENTISFKDIDYNQLKKIELLYYASGYKTNGLSHFLRTLKAVFNKAILAGCINEDSNPFIKYKIKSDRTDKRAISKHDIEKIRDIELCENSGAWHTRNYFMFSFYLMGLNFVDIAYLKKSNISGISNNKAERVTITYIRKKTSKVYKMDVPLPAMSILEQYNIYEKATEDYIFPILTKQNAAAADQEFLNKYCSYKYNLKKIGSLCKIEQKLTGYVARHSWASIALKIGIPIGIISQGLGHEDIKTTQIYLESFDDDAMNKANLLIIG